MISILFLDNFKTQLGVENQRFKAKGNSMVFVQYINGIEVNKY